MNSAVLVAWLHYVSLMILTATLVAEHLLLKPQPTLEQAKTLQVLDAVYGISAVALLATGVARMFLEKGVDYYLHHFQFHILLTLFAVAGLLSIYPTVKFIGWRRSTRAGTAPVLAAADYRRMQMVLRIEITLMLIAPLFAAWMARGV
jgi:putative membrane protein